jgi:anti-sigma B factor antagonist
MSEALVLPDSITSRADPQPPVFALSRTNGDPDAAWIRVAGELDFARAQKLEDTLRESLTQARLVVLDLRQLVFIDSSGVHAIVNASLRARQIGRRLVLLGGPPDLDDLFTITGTRDDVEIGDIDAVPAPMRRLV